jgi:hypothetical protein
MAQQDPVKTAQVFEESVQYDLIQRIQSGTIPVGFASNLFDLLLSCGLDGDIIATMIRSRAEKGRETYGGYLVPNNGRSARLDFLEEIADALVYAWQIDMEEGR